MARQIMDIVRQLQTELEESGEVVDNVADYGGADLLRDAISWLRDSGMKFDQDSRFGPDHASRDSARFTIRLKK